jgi:hypothetical protein
MASCIIRDKDMAGGLQMASDVLINLPAGHRSDIFLRYAWSVASAVPARFRNDPDAAEYRELLRDLSH